MNYKVFLLFYMQKMRKKFQQRIKRSLYVLPQPISITLPLEKHRNHQIHRNPQITTGKPSLVKSIFSDTI